MGESVGVGAGFDDGAVERSAYGRCALGVSICVIRVRDRFFSSERFRAAGPALSLLQDFVVLEAQLLPY